jgi:hypothetical protein
MERAPLQARDIKGEPAWLQCNEGEWNGKSKTGSFFPYPVDVMLQCEWECVCVPAYVCALYHPHTVTQQ